MTIILDVKLKSSNCDAKASCFSIVIEVKMHNMTQSANQNIWCILYSCGDQWDFTGGVASMIDRMSSVTYDGGLKYLYFF